MERIKTENMQIPTTLKKAPAFGDRGHNGFFRERWVGRMSVREHAFTDTVTVKSGKGLAKKV